MYNFSFLLLFSFVKFTKRCGKLLVIIEGAHQDKLPQHYMDSSVSNYFDDGNGVLDVYILEKIYGMGE